MRLAGCHVVAEHAHRSVVQVVVPEHRELDDADQRACGSERHDGVDDAGGALTASESHDDRDNEKEQQLPRVVETLCRVQRES